MPEEKGYCKSNTITFIFTSLYILKQLEVKIDVNYKMQNGNPYCKLTVPILLQFVIIDWYFSFRSKQLLIKKKKLNVWKSATCLRDVNNVYRLLYVMGWKNIWILGFFSKKVNAVYKKKINSYVWPWLSFFFPDMFNSNFRFVGRTQLVI